MQDLARDGERRADAEATERTGVEPATGAAEAQHLIDVAIDEMERSVRGSVLVIEDDPTVGKFIKRGLEEQRWSVDLVADVMGYFTS